MNITYKIGKGTETFGNIEIEKKAFTNIKTQFQYDVSINRTALFNKVSFDKKRFWIFH